jgi:PAP2 superfamily
MTDAEANFGAEANVGAEAKVGAPGLNAAARDQPKLSPTTDVRHSRDMVRLEQLMASHGLNAPMVPPSAPVPAQTAAARATFWFRTVTLSERSLIVTVPLLIATMIGAFCWSMRAGLTVQSEPMAMIGWATLLASALIGVSMAANLSLDGRTRRVAKLSRRIGLRVQLTATAALLLLALSVTATVLAHLVFGISDGSDLRDAQFMAFDQRLGFDWSAYISRLNRDAAFGNVLIAAHPFAPVLIATPVLLLGLTYQRRRLAEYICTLTLATLAALLLLALVPTAGAYGHLQPDASVFASLNAEAGRAVSDMINAWHSATSSIEPGVPATGSTGRLIDPLNVGIALAVPGLQVALAVLVMYSLRRMLLTGVIAAAVSILFILSPLNEGGQYLSQLLAGGMIAVGCILFTQVLRFKRRQRPAPPVRLKVDREADFLTWEKPAR